MNEPAAPAADDAPLRCEREERLQRRPVAGPDRELVGRDDIAGSVLFLGLDLDPERGPLLGERGIVDLDIDGRIDAPEPGVGPGARGRPQFPLRASSPRMAAR